MLLEDTAAEFFFLHWKVVHFLLLVTTWRRRWCYNCFPQKWRLFRPPLELIDQGWQCMTCGTWHVARAALTSNQGREKLLLSSWAEEAVVNPSGDCRSIVSYKAALINSVRFQLSQKLDAPSVGNFHHVWISHGTIWSTQLGSSPVWGGNVLSSAGACAPGEYWSRTLI